MLSQSPPSRQTTQRSASVSIDVWNEVPLVHQTTGMSCWAAAAAMIVGWRDRVVVDPEAVARGAGRWAEFRDGLEPEDIDELATAWGLVVERPHSWSVASMSERLTRVGPLWLGEASPGLHSIVVTGMFGDGTPDGTQVRINDPWPVGVGERYVLPFRQLMRNFKAATEVVGAHAQLMHAGGRKRGNSIRQMQTHRASTTVSADGSTREDSMDTFSRTTSSRSRWGRGTARPFDVRSSGEANLSSSAFGSDPLAQHGGNGDNLFVRWGSLHGSLEAIDVVVHLHGYSSEAATPQMFEGKVGRAGADLAGRVRPTLVVIPRGRRITAAEREREPGANPNRYTFPGLLAERGAGLETLVAQCLQWLAQSVLARDNASGLLVDRFILTAHSGGGTAANALLREHSTRQICNPHELHLFDATYGPHDGIASWVASRIASDRSPSGIRPDMAATGGGMRVLFRPGERSGTASHAAALGRVIAAPEALGGAAGLAPWYRVEPTSAPHGEVSQRFGAALLENVAGDLAPAAQSQGRYGTPLGLFTALQRGGQGPTWSAPRTPRSAGYATQTGPRRTLEEINELGAEAASRGSARGLQVHSRALAQWADDAQSVDYRHLQPWPGVNETFSFSGDTLAALAAANHFAIPTEGRILFGLRGCTIMSGLDGAFHDSVQLDQDIPDHIHNRCVIGVWRRDTNQVAVFSGSTVPNEHWMRQQVGDAGTESNMLLTGKHEFKIGRHGSRIDGVFREAETRVIVRSRNDRVYTTDDDFHRYQPGDNLHPSFEPHLSGSTYEFSSAGCLTVAGDATNYNARRNPDLHTDPDGEVGWATFRGRAGLTSASAPDSEDGRRFKMILLTGREAFIGAAGSVAELARLRFGSTGPEVESLQTYLRAQGYLPRDSTIDGAMGAKTTEAFVAYQKARDGGHADGIVTPSDATTMGFSLGPVATGSAMGRPYGGYRFGRVQRHAYGRRSRGFSVDSDSSQVEQSDAVRLNIADSVGRAETSLRFDLVHDDSNRINFGIGSWTGTRIADVLDSYTAFAAEAGITAQLHGHFGSEAAFEGIRDRFRANGTATTLTTAERGQLEALGGDTDLQTAQRRHLATDIRADLDAIGSTPPWYPYIDGGMGAITEIAAHVLVHARHQSGSAGILEVIQRAIDNLGGDEQLGRDMVAGTVTERDVLEEIRDVVVSRVQARYRRGVRNRYNRLFTDYESSDLSYYFDPEPAAATGNSAYRGRHRAAPARYGRRYGGTVGQLQIGNEHHVLEDGDTPVGTFTGLDEAIATGLSETAHAFIVGNMFEGTSFVVHSFGVAASLPVTPVIEADVSDDICALVLNGSNVFVRASEGATRWVELSDADGFYALTEEQQEAQQSKWIKAIEKAMARDSTITYTGRDLEDLPMPALRLLIARFPNTYRVKRVDDGNYQGGSTRGSTWPFVTVPVSEPTIYAVVIAGREGKLESINAYDWKAGVSLGPIQINANRGAILRFLGKLWTGDRVLFEQAFGGLNWSMKATGSRMDLIVNAGAANEVVLQGGDRSADVERMYAYLQSGDPTKPGTADYDLPWRRDLTERFRNVVVWPHVQGWLMETISWWLQKGLDKIHAAGIPALAGQPDKDTFVLKAMLMSAYVRYSSCLSKLLSELSSYSTVSEKLANWQTALANTSATCRKLEERLEEQQEDAEEVHAEVLRLLSSR